MVGSIYPKKDVFYRYYTPIVINPEIVYTDLIRKTVLRVDLGNRLIQFVAMGMIYPVEEADMMLMRGSSITIVDRGEVLLLAAEINTRKGLCVAVAVDRQTRNRYLLVTR